MWQLGLIYLVCIHSHLTGLLFVAVVTSFCISVKVLLFMGLLSNVPFFMNSTCDIPW